MSRQTVTFRLDSEKKKALDAIAAGLDRDRSYVLNEAVRSYLEIYQWQAGHIKEGLRQADAGQFAAESQVNEAFGKWRRCLPFFMPRGGGRKRCDQGSWFS